LLEAAAVEVMLFLVVVARVDTEHQLQQVCQQERLIPLQ
jgi:hypothetical protein